MKNHRLLMVSSFILATSLTACGGSGGSLPGAAGSTTAQSQTANSQAGTTQRGESLAIATSVAASSIAIAAGGAASGAWIADTDFTNGWSAASTVAVDTHLISNPAPQSVYRTQRLGTVVNYSVPNLTPSGNYTVRLHFVESWFTSAGQRVFSASLNGSQVLSNFDVFKAAGGKNIAIAESFVSKADASGKIAIALSASVNNAMITGIEITAIPTSVASPTPAPTPTPKTSSSAWPAAGWVAYPKSPLTEPVAPNPTYTASSAGMIKAMWSQHSTSDVGHIQVYAGQAPPSNQDWSLPLYFGRASDPVYTVSCYDYGGGCRASGLKVHIPKGAYPAGGTDHHLSVRDLVTGQDVMMWEVPVPNGNGGTLSVGWGTYISSNSDGTDAVGSTASGLSELWSLRATDLIHDTINHAILVSVTAESADGWAYPAVGWDNAYFHADPWPEYGAHFWLDVAPPYGENCPQYAVSYLTALHKYGAFFSDYGGTNSPIQPQLESDVSYTSQGLPSAWGPLMQSIGGTAQGNSDIAIDACGINMTEHMHVLNPPTPI